MGHDDDYTWSLETARRGGKSTRPSPLQRVVKRMVIAFLLVLLGFVGGCMSMLGQSSGKTCPLPHAIALIDQTQTMLHDVSAKHRADNAYLLSEIRSARTVGAQHKADLDVCYRHLKQKCPKERACAALNPFRIELS
eukprot:TRINITY_DN11608_c0_g1_i1.p2 TRINITY_DN11608_c0_g1~~TRINITY_DN11608_c0_g1_i1.p2  ORF type:complete len:137 (+),score=26.51 TRINITY_DN11608_c0_g1_i1:137-547(+)